MTQHQARAEKQLRENIARFAKVRHLNNAEVAREFGISAQYVGQYRKQHPEIRHTPPQSAPQRDIGAETASALADARRASVSPQKRVHIVPGNAGLSYADSMAARRVSLPAEPWGKV